MGFWQIPLTERSKLLTTFITPFGRYYFHKLPFGICCAPEHFQRRMSRILLGLNGIPCQMDNVLVFGKDKEEHDVCLSSALNRIQDAGVTLNKEKCEFAKAELILLGHLIDQHGIRPDPVKTLAIRSMSLPSNIEKILGYGEPAGKILTSVGTDDTASSITAQQEPCMAMGPSSRSSLCAGERRTLQAYCSSILLSKHANQIICRCLFSWPR